MSTEPNPAEPRQGMLTAEEVAILTNEHSEVYLAPEYRMHCAKCDISQPCDAARLLADRAQLETALAEARTVIEWYGNLSTYSPDKQRVKPMPITTDFGLRAREWLAKQEAGGE